MGGDEGGDLSSLPENLIAFDVGRKEVFTPQSGLKSWQRKLRNHQFKTTSIRDEITPEKLAGIKCVVFVGPRDKFTSAEFEVLREYLENGGSIFLLLGEGGESKYDTNFNFFLEDYGIAVNSDAVVRASYYKLGNSTYHHPKECVVSGGVLNREISKAAGKDIAAGASALTFLYPYGATLTVQKPAVPVLSSGSVSLPVNQPVAGFYEHPRSRGKLAVLGSCHMFQDAYIEKEENAKVLDVIMQWISSDNVALNAIDADNPSVDDYHFLPDTGKLAEQLRVGLQEGDELPRDTKKLYDHNLFAIDTSAIPDAKRAYDQLGVKHEQLRLIQPQFETPMPPLEPAVFPPRFREVPAPALDLFDLDDSFSDEKVRLAQLTNKCTEDDLEYFVREAGEIMGVSSKLTEEQRASPEAGKHILEYIFRQVVDYKKGSSFAI